MVKLFDLGENGKVTLNKEWIAMIPEFQRILAMDKGGPQDGSGKYKKQAIRQFTFIYLMYDYRSVLENYEESERYEESLRCSELTKGDIQKSEAMTAAIKKYIELQNNCSKTLQVWRKLKATADKLSTYLEDIDLTLRTDTNNKVHSIKEVQDGIRNMPQTLQALEDLEEEVKRQMADGGGVRAGKQKGFREDPDE